MNCSILTQLILKSTYLPYCWNNPWVGEPPKPPFRSFRTGGINLNPALLVSLMPNGIIPTIYIQPSVAPEIRLFRKGRRSETGWASEWISYSSQFNITELEDLRWISRQFGIFQLFTYCQIILSSPNVHQKHPRLARTKLRDYYKWIHFRGMNSIKARS